MQYTNSKLNLNLEQKGLWISLAKIALSVFCAETFVMLLFLVLPKLPDLVETFVDSTLLSVLIAPALYCFVYCPLLQEISERSQVEVELRQTQARLEQQAQQLEETLKKLQQAPQLIQAEKMASLGRLVAGVAHEINNPINFIHGNLDYVQAYTKDLLSLIQLYRQRYSSPEPEIQAWVDDIDLEFLPQDLAKILSSMRAGTERIRQIVLSLRNFSRIDEAEFKAVNLHEGIDSALVILQHRFKAKPDHLPVELIKDYGDLPQVECFPGQLNQVFMNILTNAIDALELRYAVLKGSHLNQNKQHDNPRRITIRTFVLNPQWVGIAIADNGDGIPEPIQPQIFNPFFTTKPVGKGTGMGLSISYQIITEKHHGKLECFSTPGQGTEFVIQIPIRQRAYAAV
jgi:two-component system NtrC family sensor kinase